MMLGLDDAKVRVQIRLTLTLTLPFEKMDKYNKLAIDL